MTYDRTIELTLASLEGIAVRLDHVQGLAEKALIGATPEREAQLRRCIARVRQLEIAVGEAALAIEGDLAATPGGVAAA